MKTVNFSVEQIMPLYEELNEFLLRKYEGRYFGPEQMAMIIGALKLSESFWEEEITKGGGSIMTSHCRFTPKDPVIAETSPETQDHSSTEREE